MEEMIQLSDLYLEIFSIMRVIEMCTKFNEEDIVFNNDKLTAINMVIVEKTLSKSRLEKHADRFSKLLNLAKSYNVSSLSEIADRILVLWDSNKEYNPIFTKNLMNILVYEEHFSGIVNKSIGRIYKEMVDKDLIENPNLMVGPVDEPLFDYLPNPRLGYLNSNLRVITNPNVNWNVYSNGVNPLVKLFDGYVAAIRENDSIMEMYYHDAIMGAIKSSCSLFNDVFQSEVRVKTMPNMLRVVGPIAVINIDFYNEIREYLLTDEGFESQKGLYVSKNPTSNEILKGLSNERYYRKHPGE